MDHATLVESLKAPTFYDHPVESVEYLQTHISSLFLTGEFAYKLKKPIDFGFLDFSTPELRQRYCEAELSLNRRLAPSMYLRVTPITLTSGNPTLGGEGEAVDWLVVMRQLDGRRLGPEVLEAGELTGDLIDAVVDKLVPFYQQADTGPGIDNFGQPEEFKINTDENFAQTANFVGRALDRQHYEDIREYTKRFFVINRELFLRRVSQGRIRDCHGDLHLGNIFFEQEPTIFDCIEFNERFRYSDIAVDLAFFFMDLEFRGHRDLAQHFLDSYVERSGDHELPQLMDFYCCYRAYVRGKIACFTSADPALDSEARKDQIGLARSYFELAHQYAGGSGLADQQGASR